MPPGASYDKFLKILNTFEIYSNLLHSHLVITDALK